MSAQARTHLTLPPASLTYARPRPDPTPPHSRALTLSPPPAPHILYVYVNTGVYEIVFRAKTRVFIEEFADEGGVYEMT